MEEVLAKIESVATSIGFLKQPNRAEDFTRPNANEPLLRRMREEHEFADGRFKLMLVPEHKPIGLWLLFYEYEREQFTPEGIARFQQLQTHIGLEGINISPQSNSKNHLTRVTQTPEQFNATHPARTIAQRVSELIPTLVMLLVYFLLAILPGMLLLRIAIKRRTWSRTQKRVILALSTTVLFAPMPTPASMFGPMILIPNAFFMVMMSPMMIRLWPWLVGSIAITSIVTYACSDRAFQKTAAHT